MEGVYGENCMDVKNVGKWSREFSAGSLNIHNKEQSSRLSHTDEKVQKVEPFVLQDCRLTLDELVENFKECVARAPYS